MFFPAMILISLGYTFAYWGANNFRHWDKSWTTDAATLLMLFGLKSGKDTPQLIHPVPFPYKVADNLGTTDGTKPVSTSTGSPGAGFAPGPPAGFTPPVMPPIPTGSGGALFT